MLLMVSLKEKRILNKRRCHFFFSIAIINAQHPIATNTRISEMDAGLGGEGRIVLLLILAGREPLSPGRSEDGRRPGLNDMPSPSKFKI
jgi:hypothetical protein